MQDPKRSGIVDRTIVVRGLRLAAAFGRLENWQRLSLRLLWVCRCTIHMYRAKVDISHSLHQCNTIMACLIANVWQSARTACFEKIQAIDIFGFIIRREYVCMPAHASPTHRRLPASKARINRHPGRSPPTPRPHRPAPRNTSGSAAHSHSS